MRPSPAKNYGMYVPAMIFQGIIAAAILGGALLIASLAEPAKAGSIGGPGPGPASPLTLIGSKLEAWDADLDCLAAISSTGIIKRTGSGTCGIATAGSDYYTANSSVVLNAGSVGSPGMSFTGDTDTGFYKGSDGEFRFSTNGTNRYRFGSNIYSSSTDGMTVYAGSVSAVTPAFIPRSDYSTTGIGATTNNAIDLINAANDTWRLDGVYHVTIKGTVPTVANGASDCGTSPSIAGNDNAGRVTVGSSTNGGYCTVTFANAWTTNAPICVAQDEVTAVLVRVTNVSTSSFRITGAIVAGDTLAYHCVGYR